MTVHLDIPYETLVELVEQLPPRQQRDLIHRLQQRVQEKGLTVEERMQRLRAVQIDAPVNQEPSTRREDWYDDYGR